MLTKAKMFTLVFIFIGLLFAEEKMVVPKIKVNCIDGSVFNLANCTDCIIVLKFMSICCSPCKDETEQLNQLVDKWKNYNILFLALAYDSYEEINEWCKQTDFKYKIAANQKETAKLFKIKTIPTHIIIDPFGGILFKQEFSSDDIDSLIDNRLSQMIELYEIREMNGL